MEISSLFVPALISFVTTVGYLLIGWQSSGESFDGGKALTTVVTELVSLIVVSCYCVGFDITGYPEIIMLLPSLITILLSKVISWVKKYHAGLL